LHHRGYAYGIFKNGFSKSPIPGFFYTYDVDDIEKNKRKFKNEEFVDDEKYLPETHNDVECLGLGDFFTFDLMILFILQPQWSIITKIFVVIGCIISIQAGQCGTLLFAQVWQLTGFPALPFSVVTFSLYTLILNVIMY
jgi:hypothetical protein